MRRNLPVLCVTIFLALCGVFSWVRLAPIHMRDRFGVTPEEVGTAFMVLAMAFRGSQLFGGWLADRVGRKPVLVAGTLSMAPFYWFAGQAQSSTMFIAMLACCWTIGSIQWPSFLAIISESAASERRGRALGWLEFGGIGGTVAGPMIGAVLLTRPGITVDHLLSGTAVLYGFIGLSRLILLTETRGTVRTEGGASTPKVGGVLAALVVGVMGMTGFYLTWDGPFPAQYLRDALAYDYAGINWIMSACGLVAMAMAVVGGRLVDRFGSARVISLAFALWMALIAAYFATPRARGVPLVVAIMVPVELFYLAYLKLSASVGSTRRRGLFVGLFGSVSGVLGAVGMHFSGLFYATAGFDGPMAVTLGACAVGSIATLLIGGVEVSSANPV